MRAGPSIEAPTVSDRVLAPGFEFDAVKCLRLDGVTFVKLKDGSGWVFEKRPLTVEQAHEKATGSLHGGNLVSGSASSSVSTDDDRISNTSADDADDRSSDGGGGVVVNCENGAVEENRTDDSLGEAKRATIGTAARGDTEPESIEIDSSSTSSKVVEVVVLELLSFTPGEARALLPPSAHPVDAFGDNDSTSRPLRLSGSSCISHDDADWRGGDGSGFVPMGGDEHSDDEGSQDGRSDSRGRPLTNAWPEERESSRRRSEVNAFDSGVIAGSSNRRGSFRKKSSALANALGEVHALADSGFGLSSAPTLMSPAPLAAVPRIHRNTSVGMSGSSNSSSGDGWGAAASGAKSQGGSSNSEWRALQDELLSLRGYQPQGEDPYTGAQSPPSASFAEIQSFLHRTALARAAHPALSPRAPMNLPHGGPSSSSGVAGKVSSSGGLARNSAAQRLEQQQSALRRLGLLLDETYEAPSVTSVRDEVLEVVWVLARLGPQRSGPLIDGLENQAADLLSQRPPPSVFAIDDAPIDAHNSSNNSNHDAALTRALKQALHKDLGALTVFLSSPRCSDLLDQIAGFPVRPTGHASRGESFSSIRNRSSSSQHRLHEALTAWLTLALSAYHDAHPPALPPHPSQPQNSSSASSKPSSIFADLDLGASSRPLSDAADPNPFLLESDVQGNRSSSSRSSREGSRHGSTREGFMQSVPVSGHAAAVQHGASIDEGGADDTFGNAAGVSGWFQRAKQRAVVLLANPEVQFAWGF